MHIYLSVGKHDASKGAYFDLAGNLSAIANYRGEAPAGKDLETFTSAMAKKGHALIARDTLAEPGEILETASGNFIAHYNGAFVVGMAKGKIASVKPKPLTPTNPPANY